MKLLYLADRLSLRGGADLHLLQVIGDAVAAGAQVRVAHGRLMEEVCLPSGVEVVRVRALASQVASSSRMAGLDSLLEWADVIHMQNVMNPVVLEGVVRTGRAVVTVQDHRVFCPGMGKTLPDGSRCSRQMSASQCRECLPDAEYCRRLLELTRRRRHALRGARLVVLSSYMADELAAAGLQGAEVLPPWVEVSEQAPHAGEHFLIGGRLVTHKGLLDGLEAWRRAATGLPLRVAGSGPLQSDLEGCELLGWLPAEALRHQLRKARALLFPARWQEPFGILGVEALAEATPVVVAATGGTCEWSGTGCVEVAAGDVAATADALRRLAHDPRRAVELGTAGRAAVAERFARSLIVGRLWALYEGLSSTPMPAPRLPGPP